MIIFIGCVVYFVIVCDGCVVGIWLGEGDEVEEVFVDEVILFVGVFGMFVILFCLGIGFVVELIVFGVFVVYDVLGVGKNFYDYFFLLVIFVIEIFVGLF